MFDLLVGLNVLSIFDFEFGIKNRIVSFIPYLDEDRIVLSLCKSYLNDKKPNNI